MVTRLSTFWGQAQQALLLHWSLQLLTVPNNSTKLLQCHGKILWSNHASPCERPHCSSVTSQPGMVSCPQHHPPQLPWLQCGDSLGCLGPSPARPRATPSCSKVLGHGQLPAKWSSQQPLLQYSQTLIYDHRQQGVGGKKHVLYFLHFTVSTS